MSSALALAQAPAQTPASNIEPLQFHHVHLNAVNPSAAADYYPKAFAKSTTRTTFPTGFQEPIRLGPPLSPLHEGRGDAARLN